MIIQSKTLGAKTTIEDLRQLQIENPTITIEKSIDQVLTLKSVSEFASGNIISDLLFQMGLWHLKYNRGILKGSPMGYTFPDHRILSPSISWIADNRLGAFTRMEIPSFVQLVPSFVIEVCTPEDKIADLIRKMETYQSLGVRLGWLIDPINECCYIFLRAGAHQVRYGFEGTLSGNEVLPKFSLNLDRLQKLR